MTIHAVRTVLATLAVSSLAFTGPALAATATSNMSVSATVTNNCTISAGPLAFGNYGIDNVNGTDLDATATLTMQCTSGASTVITLGQGLNPTGTSTDATPDRRMLSGSDLLSYSLYRASDYSGQWGNDGANGLAYTGQGTSTAVTIYGRVPGGQNIAAGNYTDTVVATVTF